ncbi:uncharacterized protein LOC122499988 [Leptopilina heterotoma]|uniref:uncharacterized protein LOC122499988 n=1 Tax=Leptopilina heterotoma TaxID=63436 RepID=UPI001CAA3E2C|nr:uncharacterized protein LOC122499988 [Leptopilina heterotoma]
MTAKTPFHEAFKQDITLSKQHYTKEEFKMITGPHCLSRFSNCENINDLISNWLIIRTTMVDFLSMKSASILYKRVYKFQLKNLRAPTENEIYNIIRNDEKIKKFTKDIRSEWNEMNLAPEASFIDRCEYEQIFHQLNQIAENATYITPNVIEE